LGIAELAKGKWPKRVRDAAERIARTLSKPDDRERLLERFHAFFVNGRSEITSEQVVTELTSDETDIWHDYNRGGPITKRQVANLLDDFDIHPVPIHPTKRSDKCVSGYKVSQFVDAFKRYLPHLPPIPSSPHRKVEPKPRQRGTRRKKRQ
jgi:hypothetical protein